MSEGILDRKLQELTYLELVKKRNPHWKHMEKDIDELKQEIKMEKELLKKEKND